MVKQITSYEDSSGKIHRNAFDAHRAELALFFGRFDVMNEASAIKLADEIANDSTTCVKLMGMLTDVRQHMSPIAEAWPAPPCVVGESAPGWGAII